MVAEFWEKPSRNIKKKKKTGNDFNSLACEGEVAPSPSDITEEQARKYLEDFFYYRNTYKHKSLDPREELKSAYIKTPPHLHVTFYSLTTQTVLQSNKTSHEHGKHTPPSFCNRAISC